jgi:hypothetical protein
MLKNGQVPEETKISKNPLDDFNVVNLGLFPSAIGGTV